MQPWLASIAAPIAANAVQSLGQAATTAAEPFAAALDRALGAAAPAGACTDCDSSGDLSRRERLQQRLAEVLAPFASQGAGGVALRIDPATRDVQVEGESPAADALREAIANDDPLRDDLLSVAEEQAGEGDEGRWPSFFAGGHDGVRLQWNGSQLVAA